MSYEDCCIKDRRTQNFLNDLSEARKAEWAVAEWIDKCKKYDLVKIVNQKGYDIECLKCDEEKDRVEKIEVKRDYYTDNLPQKRRGTNNICVELWSNFDAGNPGWVKYTDSDWIYYLSNIYLYIINTVSLKKFANLCVDYGKSPDIEPCLTQFGKKCMVSQTLAPKNGNFKVRNLLVNKEVLIRNKCIVGVLDREECGINKVAHKYDT